MASKKLRDLTTKRATADHQEEFNKHISDDADDRSVRLLLPSVLERSVWSPRLRKEPRESARSMPDRCAS
ncbi:MAG: hypothetical protein KGL35_03425 [Bradyrhizobium sp.]|uniref:hypothetical protein n=1 Tax=Bradyrhizobium sp. TaxID=376 RepID=UPI001C289B48|nr:hypothetical protein [Bradyrhizobium sp.]MBU6461382.1 hypothetical protein [Pseudomonadota bacterium]MDE2066560.1 hypothetical protein [Bradyrhizobium sp.]MDE2467798.1 hypothetical protein [Bradyrhizobium sp.]